jgi:hypothetical protein
MNHSIILCILTGAIPVLSSILAWSMFVQYDRIQHHGEPMPEKLYFRLLMTTALTGLTYAAFMSHVFSHS